MIRTFRDRRTQRLYTSRADPRLAPGLARRAVQKLDLIDLAVSVDELRFPPGNRLHALKGNRVGQWAIAVNDQWRICFRWKDGDAFDVELCDYH